MRALAILLVLALPLAGSAFGQPALAPDDLALARQEQASAERELKQLEDAARQAKGRSERLARERQAAAMAIEVSEARITAAELRLRRQSARLVSLKRALAQAQRPVSALLAGLAMMGERPPIVALADRGGLDELVRTRILLKATMPYVRRRSAALTRQIGVIEQQEVAAAQARAALIEDRKVLAERQRRLIALEDRAFAQAVAVGGAALEAGDRVLAGREALNDNRRGATLAAELLGEDPSPLRPGRSDARPAVTIDYALPADAPVVRGLAEIDRAGIRSRGLTLATARGAPILVPADGVLRFAGPFENFDGIAIIDHGGGWFSLIVNVAVPQRVGKQVQRGELLGRALGPVEVELSRNGQLASPAIIAGSSRPLFKGR